MYTYIYIYIHMPYVQVMRVACGDCTVVELALEKKEEEGWVSGTSHSVHTILHGRFAVMENG